MKSHIPTRHPETGARLTAVILFLLVLCVYGCGDTARQESEIPGTWQRTVVSGTASFTGLLTFGSGGSFTFTFEGNAVGHEKSEGTYSFSGRDIKFENKSCRGVGRYRFLVKGSSLTFIPLADGCARRKAVITGEWRRRGTENSRAE